MAKTRTKPPRVKPANSKPRASRSEPEELDLPHAEFERPSDAALERLDRERAQAVADQGAASKAKAEADARITKRLDEIGAQIYKAKSGRVLTRTTKDVLRVKRPPSKEEKAKRKVRGASAE